MSEHDSQRRPRRARMLLDRALSSAAGIVALSALSVSVYQAYISREQQRMSVWPYVTMQHFWEHPGSGYSIRVMNDGLGPALVHSVEVRVDGVARRNWNDVARALLGTDAQVFYGTFHTGSVLLPGSQHSILQMPVDSQALAFFKAQQQPLRGDTAHARLEIVACYCSLFGDCWRTESDQEQPEPVKACAAPRTPWSN